MDTKSPTLLILSQVYVPDPASVGQHLHDTAVEMTERGIRVRVVTSARGYESPDRKYPAKEVRDGVYIRRLPFSSFGKRSIAARLLGQCVFLVQAVVRGCLTRRLRGILVSTSPPMCSVAALCIAAIRRVPIVYWVMDINPDQAIRMGVFSKTAWPVRAFHLLNRFILRGAARVVTLDRFMAARLLEKRDISDKLDVFPPWPHDGRIVPVPHANNPFRRRHGLEGKFVVMYSGNHSKAHPISTLLKAAKRLEHDDGIRFVFVGGGHEKHKVEERIRGGAPNLISLPYEPLEQLKYSLSAADVHVVTVGGSVVGIVHPCKIYGAMAAARPILLIGPDPSHASEILDETGCGRRVFHGDVDGAVDAIRELARMTPFERAQMGHAAREFVALTVSKERLCGRLGDILCQCMEGSHERDVLPFEPPTAEEPREEEVRKAA